MLSSAAINKCLRFLIISFFRETAIERIVERDHKTKEEAQMRIDNQMTNQERVKVRIYHKPHVKIKRILCLD